MHNVMQDRRGWVRGLKDKGMPVTEIARYLGLSKQAIYNMLGTHPGIRKRVLRPWTAAEDFLLGRISDQEVARQTGRHVTTVFHRRSKLGIPACRPRGERNRGEWSTSEEKLLGTMSDSAVARQLGRSRTEVIEHRRSLGIATWRRQYLS
jgi:hypothetical protein